MCVTMPVAMLQDFVQHARASIGSRRWRLGLGSSGMAANRPRVLWMRMCVVRSDTDVSECSHAHVHAMPHCHALRFR